MAKLSDRTELTTPADGDLYVTTDVSDTTDAATGTDKKITWANIKAALKTYFDTLYAAALGADDNYVTDAEKTKLSNLSGTNTGDQTSIVGITGTKAQFDTAVTDGNFMYVGDAPTSHSHEGTAILSTGEVGGTKYLREDGDGTCSWQAVAGVTFSGARVYKSGAQSIGTTFVAVTFDTESYDSDTYHDNVTNNTRLTVPSNGYYRIVGTVTTEANAGAGARIRVDGSTIIAGTAVGNVTTSVSNGAIVVTDYYLTSGQYVELLGYFGSTQNSSSGLGGCTFSIHKIG